MQQDDSLKTSSDESARSETSAGSLERVVTRGLLAYDPWLLEFFEMKCRAKAIVDANPDLYPVTDQSPKHRYTSRKLSMTPLERKGLADGVRAARRRISALDDPNVRL